MYLLEPLKSAFDAFGAALLSTYKLDQFDVDVTKAKHQLSADLMEQYQRLNRPKTMAGRAEFFSTPHRPFQPSDFKEHFLDLGNLKVCCGIRHLSLDVNRPFLSIACNENLSTGALIELYHHQLKPYFEVFQPQYIQCFEPQTEITSQTYLLDVVGFAKEIHALPVLPFENELQLQEPSKHQNWYELYREFYTDRLISQTALSERLIPSSKSYLEASAHENKLKIICQDGIMIGLISAFQEPFLGSKGINMVEITIDPVLAGKGIGAAAQRKFIRQLATPDDYVFGTIDALNIGSMKTALSNNRVVIRREEMVEITI